MCKNGPPVSLNSLQIVGNRLGGHTSLSTFSLMLISIVEIIISENEDNDGRPLSGKNKDQNNGLKFVTINCTIISGSFQLEIYQCLKPLHSECSFDSE